MKQYKVYANPQGESEAVKVGWSWPAFFFSWIWALVKKMWGLGIGAFVAFFMLGVIEGAVEVGSTQDTAMTVSLIVNLVVFVAVILFGVHGNRWRETNLQSRGFEFKSDVTAQNPEAAIADWTKDSQATAAAPAAPAAPAGPAAPDT